MTNSDGFEAEKIVPAPFYDSDERYSPDATALDEKMFAAIRPIMEEYRAKGYRAREIAHIMQGTVSELELMMVLGC